MVGEREREREREGRGLYLRKSSFSSATSFIMLFRLRLRQDAALASDRAQVKGTMVMEVAKLTTDRVE